MCVFWRKLYSFMPLYWRDLANPISASWSRLISAVIIHVGNICPCNICPCNICTLPLVLKNFKIKYDNSNTIRKKSDGIQKGGLCKIPDHFFKIVKIIRCTKSLRNSHNLEKFKETWWLNVIFYLERCPDTEKWR